MRRLKVGFASLTVLGIRRLSVEVGRRTGWLGEWFLKPVVMSKPGDAQHHNHSQRGSYLHWYLGCSPRQVQCLRESWCATWSCVLLLPGQILPRCWNSQTRFHCEGMIIAERHNDCESLCRHVRTPATCHHHSLASTDILQMQTGLLVWHKRTISEGWAHKCT